MDIHKQINHLSEEELRYIWRLCNQKNKKCAQEIGVQQIKEELHKYIHEITEENNQLTAIEQINDTFITSIEVVLKCLLKPKYIKGFNLDEEQIKVLLKQIEKKRNSLKQERTWGEDFCIAIMVRLGGVFNNSKRKIESSTYLPAEIISNFPYINGKIWDIVNKYIVVCCGCICEKESETHKGLRKTREALTNGVIRNLIKAMFKAGALGLINNSMAVHLLKGVLIPVGGILVIGVPMYLGVTCKNEWKDADKKVWQNAKKQLLIGSVLYQHSYKEVHV